MEEQQERLRDMEKRYMEIIEELDRSHLRKMQGDMHRCAADCCDKLSSSMDSNQRCIQNCGALVQNAQEYVQTEIDRLQNRWNRCIMECNDRVMDHAAPKDSTAKLSEDFGSCAAACIDSQFDLLRIARTNMDKVLTRRKQDGARM